MSEPQEGFQQAFEDCPVSWCSGRKPAGQAVCLNCWHHAPPRGRTAWNQAVRANDPDAARSAREEIVRGLEERGKPAR